MKKYLLAFLVFTTAAATVQASVLAIYNFESANNRYASSDTDLQSTAAAILAGGPRVPAFALANANVSGTRALRFQASNVMNDNTDFFSFTLSANSGLTLNLSSATLSISSRVSNMDPLFNYTIRSSVNNYTTDIGTYQQTSINQWVNQDYTLSGSSYNGLSSVTFRVYVDDNGNTGTSSFYFDNITLGGSATVVPEPATIAGGIFCGLFVAGAFGRRLLKNRQS